MTDRELLEAAAKAAGIEGYWVDNYGSGDYYYRGNSDGIYTEHDDVWNPLTDDGDALWLAHKLGLLSDVSVWPRTLEETRRAIVRSAAAMAKEKAE